MLAALVAMAFLAGIFAGIIILAMVFVHLVNRDKDKTLEEKLIAAREPIEGVGYVPADGPILT